MFTPLRVRLVALFALVVALAVGSSTASAVLIPLLVNPAGASAATSVGPVTFTLLLNNFTITCQASTITKTVLANGSGTVPIGGAMYMNCANPLVGVVVVNNPKAWTLQVVAELLTTPDRVLLVGLEFRVPVNGLRFAHPLCTFTVSGTFTLGKVFPAQALPITQPITSADQFRVLPLPKQNLAVDGLAGAGCGAIGIAPGTSVRKDGTYVLRAPYTASQR